MNCSTIDAKELASHTSYLVAYAMRRLGDRESAQDVVQDTMVAVLSGNADFAGRSALRTWLVGILKHKIMDTYRERTRTPVSLDAMEDAGDDPASHDVAAQTRTSSHVDPVAAYERTRFWETFERALARLPARTASAFVLSELSSLDSGGVCKELGVTANFLGVMRHRAKAMLRVSMAPEYAL